MPNDKFALAPSEKIGLIQELVLRIKLILRLMADRRVNVFLKLLPVAALVYLLSPVDLAPGLTLPVIGTLDDAAVLWMGASLFVALCPEEVVQEHLAKLQKGFSVARPKEEQETQIITITPKTGEEHPEQTD